MYDRMENNYSRMPPTHTTNNGAVSSGDKLGGGGALKAPRNFKLLSDPALTKGAPKLYRFDGIVATDPTYPPVMPRDPRNPVVRIRARPVEPMVLSLPRLKIDLNYVGNPPAIEVTVTNLNDNIDKQFLSRMLEKCGLYDDIVIYHHPTTNKHLGVARIIFENVKAARLCVEKYNQKSVMGKILSVFHDPFGSMCKQTVENLTSTKPKGVPATVPASANSIPEVYSTVSTLAIGHPQGTHNSEHNQEYVSQDGFESSYQQHSYRSERDYERYSVHSRERYDDDRPTYKRSEGRDGKRDKYSIRYDQDRSGKHHHYHRKRDRSRDHSHERPGGVSRRERDHNRMRDHERSRDRRDRERDYCERERERSGERDRLVKTRGTSSRYNRDYSESAVSTSTISYTSSSSSVYYTIPNATHLIGAAPLPASYDYHSYGYGSADDQQPSALLWHSGGSRNWSSLQAQLPPQPPLPPPPPDGTPNWDEPEPPPPGGYSSNDEAIQNDQKIQRKGSGTPTDTKLLKLEDKGGEDASTDLGTVDLDTRIAMMFKGKSFGNAPPFLQMDSSESEAEKSSKTADRKADGKGEEEGELYSDSNDKSFSKRHSRKSRNDGTKPVPKKIDAMQHGASDISSSDDEILLKKESYSPIQPGHLKKEEDRMSLSSLSSTEHGNEKEKLSQTPASSDSVGLAASYVYPTNPAANTYYYPGRGYPTYPHTDVSTSMQYFPNPAYIQSSYLPGIGANLSAFGGTVSCGSYNEAYRDAYKFYRSDGYAHFMGSHPVVYNEDPYKNHIEEVVQRVSDELKQILKRDFNKKMIENTAFKSFEAWWDDQMQTNRRHKNEAEKTSEMSILIATKLNSSATVPTTTRLDKPPDINQLINSHRDLSDFNSGYPALGLRASIPKLPSFRRIRKQPSPKSQKADDEKRLSDQEEMVQGSDSEKDDSNLSSAALQQIVSRSNSTKDPKTRQDEPVKVKAAPSIPNAGDKRKGSSSSFFSSSSSSEADNEDDEEDEGSSVDGDDSASEDDLSSITDEGIKTPSKNQKVGHKNRNKQRTPPARDFYSDSDEDDLDSVAKIIRPAAVKLQSSDIKSSIYSDTDEEEQNNAECDKSKLMSDLKATALVSDLEDISKDSSFSLGYDETQDCKKVAKCDVNNAIKSNNGDSGYTLPVPPSDRNQKEEHILEQKKPMFEYDRIYSDSDEEREYQEKRRRNTEYMAQIEREFLEEQQRKLQEAQQDEPKKQRPTDDTLCSTSGNGLSLTLSHKSTNIEMPETPDITKAPPTPGAKLSSELFNLSNFNANEIGGGNREKSSSVKSKKEKLSTTSRTDQAKSKKDCKPIKTPAAVQSTSSTNQDQDVFNANHLCSDKSTINSASVEKTQGDSNGHDAKIAKLVQEPTINSAVSKSTSDQTLETLRATDMKSSIPPNYAQTEEEIEKIKMSPTSSDGGSSQASQASQVALEHCYSLPPEADTTSTIKTSSNGDAARKKQHYLAHDHGGYTTPPNTVTSSLCEEMVEPQATPPVLSAMAKPGPGRPRKDSGRSKKKDDVSNQQKFNKRVHPSDIPSVVTYNNFAKALATFEPREMFKPRDATDEMMVLYEFLTRGIDAEDIQYVRRCYEMHLQEDTYGFLLNNTHWVDHCVTDRAFVPPPNKKRKKDDELKHHKTGCARTEGFYKLDVRDKAKHKYHHAKANVENAYSIDKADEQSSNQHNKLVSKMQGISREARSNQRRLLTAFGSIGESELLKFNQLKFRKKQLKFAKSAIHDWGLFAMEPIAADEMVIEYVGQMIRPIVADLRETKYEAIGIGSSYLFRIDMETIIDATKCGNLARFINHSCNEFGTRN